MDDGLKQRLVGAIVIVAAAIIFIPMIFNQTERTPKDIQVELPPPPEAPKAQLEKPQRPGVTENTAESVTGNVTENAGEMRTESRTESREDSPAESAAAVQPAKQSDIPQGWVLQLASFKERANADALRDRLRKAGYDVYVTYHPGKGDGMARVYVGPELDRAALDKIKVRLKKEFKLEGFVVRYPSE